MTSRKSLEIIIFKAYRCLRADKEWMRLSGQSGLRDNQKEQGYAWISRE